MKRHLQLEPKNHDWVLNWDGTYGRQLEQFVNLGLFMRVQLAAQLMSMNTAGRLPLHMYWFAYSLHGIPLLTVYIGNLARFLVQSKQCSIQTFL